MKGCAQLMRKQEVCEHGVGSFVLDPNAGYKESIQAAMESMEANYNLHYLQDFTKILSYDSFFETYRDAIFGDLIDPTMEGSFSQMDADSSDGYYAMHGAKLQQLVENTRVELVNEASSIGNLEPIVALTMPILKKVYLENQFKDMLQVIIADKPLINISYERKFLKDVKGNKYWIPDVFYDDSYRTIMSASIGKEVSGKDYELTPAKPISKLNMLTESGGSIEKRDALSYDFCIKSVVVTVPNDSTGEDVTVEVNVHPNMHTKTFNHTIEIPSKKTGDQTKVEVILMGNFDPYFGTVNLTAIGPVKSVKFGGHLSNSNNTEMVELDRQRFDEQILIPEQERLNTGITIERIKDEKALANIDTTLELITDMSEVLAQAKDSNIKNFFEESFQKCKNAPELKPMGYEVKFAWETLFPLGKPSDFMNPESMWRSAQVRYYFERLLSMMKQQLKTSAIMFCISANPFLIDLLSATDNDVRWVVDNDTKIGGVKLDYKFGVMTISGTRCHILSSMKETIEKGFRIVAYMLTDTLITYRQYDYTFNIENNYRNPLTPNIPNIMACQRYKNFEFLPLQGEFAIKEYRDGNYGLAPVFD